MTSTSASANWGTAATDPIDAAGARYTEAYVSAADGAALKVMHWQPAHGPSAAPVVFVPGWISVVAGWARFLRALVARRPVFYVETREKASARLPVRRVRAAHFEMSVIARDLAAVCAALPIDPAQTIVAGSSLGATALLEAFKGGALQARAAFLVAPNSEFRLPWITRLVIPLPNPLFLVVKYPIIWVLRTRVDAKAEPEQLKRYEQTVFGADPGRLKRSAEAIMGYQIWPDLERVACPVGIAYAASDTLHGADNIHRMVDRLPRATPIECASNRYMHSASLVDDLERFVGDLP